MTEGVVDVGVCLKNGGLRMGNGVHEYEALMSLQHFFCMKERKGDGNGSLYWADLGFLFDDIYAVCTWGKGCVDLVKHLGDCKSKFNELLGCRCEIVMTYSESVHGNKQTIWVTSTFQRRRIWCSEENEPLH